MNHFLELMNNLKWQGGGRNWRSFFQLLTNGESRKQLFLDVSRPIGSFTVVLSFLIAKQCGILENSQYLRS